VSAEIEFRVIHSIDINNKQLMEIVKKVVKCRACNYAKWLNDTEHVCRVVKLPTEARKYDFGANVSFIQCGLPFCSIYFPHKIATFKYCSEDCYNKSRHINWSNGKCYLAGILLG